MVGTLLNSRKDHEEAIRAWMNAVTADGGIDRYDDLHVDRIDADWKVRNSWVSAGLESFEIAVSIRDSDASNLVVVLAFSLESDKFLKGVNFRTRKELESNFHATPPSLYLFRPGTEFWTQTAPQMRVEKVDWEALFGDNHPIRKCLYMEFKRHRSEDYTRSLFVAG